MSRFRFLALAFAVGAAACGSSPATPTTPTTPATVTDTFGPAPLNQNGGFSYTFTTAQSGQVTATISTLLPNSSLIVGLALGTWSGNACQIILSKDSSTQGSFIVGQASQASTFCVRIYDVGNITDPISYEIQVNHP